MNMRKSAKPSHSNNFETLNTEPYNDAVTLYSQNLNNIKFRLTLLKTNSEDKNLPLNKTQDLPAQRVSLKK